MSSEMRLYVLESLPTDLIKMDSWEKLEQVLTDLNFIEAKCAAAMTYELIADYNTALDALPEAQEDKQKEQEREERVKKYKEDLIAYAKGEIERLAIISCVEIWSDERTRRDVERITNNPTRLDRIRAFAQFVDYTSHALLDFASHPGFLVQQACNWAYSGPVRSSAESIVYAERKRIFLLKNPAYLQQCPPYTALVRTLKGHAKGVQAVSITPDGKRAMSASYDYTLRVWDLESGECILTLDVLEGDRFRYHPNCITITSDGTRAFLGGSNDTLSVWDLEVGECLRVLFANSGGVTCVCVTPDGKLAVSGGGFGSDTIEVLDIERGKCVRRLKGHSDLAASVSITPDGKRAVSGSYDKTLRVWDVESGACIRTLKGHTKDVLSVSVTPDGKRGVSGSEDRTIRVWDLENGECDRILEGHTRSVDSVSITADGKRAVSSGDTDHTIRVWDLESGECVKILEGHTAAVTSVSLTPDGRLAVSGSLENTLRVWDLVRGTSVRSTRGYGVTVNSLSVNPNGKRAISAGDDSSLRVWDVETGECRRVIECRTNWPNWLKGHPDLPLHCVSFTPDTKRALSAGDDMMVRVWDLESGTCIKSLMTKRMERRARHKIVRVSPDGRRAVFAGGKSTQLWDLESGNCLGAYTAAMESVSVTPDGKRTVSVVGERLYIWNLERCRSVKTLKGKAREVMTAVDVTPDGKRAIVDSEMELWDSEGRDYPLLVWALKDGKCITRLRGHTARITSVSVTPDGKRAVTASHDSTLRMWDLESSECLAVIDLSEVNVTLVSPIRPDGNFVCGTYKRGIILFNAHNLVKDRYLTTPVRAWINGENLNTGHWENDVKALCYWCGQRFPVANKILAVIEAINRNANLSPEQSPCLQLPRETWDEPRLLSECPSCHKPLKFNPFIVDNRGRY